MPINYAPFASHSDGNQVPTEMGVVGTLGTADTGGTAQPLPFSVDPLTGAAWVKVINGTVTTGAGTQPVSGTVTVAGGTINSATAVLNSGTINVATAQISGGTLNAGTVTSNQGGAWSITSFPQVFNTAAGTFESFTSSNGGTTGINVSVTRLQSGTINSATVVLNSGTINVGTFNLNPIPTIGQSTYGTLGTTGASLVGTLAGGTGTGAGTEIFITSLSLSMPSTAGSQDVSIGWGTAAGTFHSGTASLVRGNFPAGGGIQKTFSPPINSGTNAQLCYFQAGAGTVDINVTYFITPSTL